MGLLDRVKESLKKGDKVVCDNTDHHRREEEYFPAYSKFVKLRDDFGYGEGLVEWCDVCIRMDADMLSPLSDRICDNCGNKMEEDEFNRNGDDVIVSYECSNCGNIFCPMRNQSEIS